jgi:hypothetical protein
VDERHVCVGDDDAFDAHCVRRGRLQAALGSLRRKPKIDDVAVLHDVLLALETDFAVIAACGHRAARNERIVGDDLSADESALDVAVNLARRELRACRARSTTRDIRLRRP